MISLVILIVASAIPAFATGGTGQIRITPALPIALTSPATFTVNVTTGKSYDPHLLLVLTSNCYNGLTGNIVVTWTGGSVTFLKTDFTGDNTNSHKVPNGATNGASYTIGSLKSHLNVANTIYWACKPFLSGPITTTPTSFTITMTSTHIKMLVYALGRSENFDFSSLSSLSCIPLLDMKVPNTIPGFVVPEAAPVMLSIGSLGALGLYAVKRRKK